MQNRHVITFTFLVLIFSIGFVWAKSDVIVGMVTETQGNAYWQNDGKKNTVHELAELPQDAKLVLTKNSKLQVVYLASGQQFQLLGPALVQFKNQQPIALTGAQPIKIGAAASVTQSKIRIETKKVQTAAQTLVSNEKQGVDVAPVAVASAPAPPPVMAAPSPAYEPLVPTDVAAASAASQQQTQADQTAMAQAMAARQAEMQSAKAQTAETESMAAARRAEAEAAATQTRASQAADAGPSDAASECQPPPATDKKDQTDQKEKKSTKTVAEDCSMITY